MSPPPPDDAIARRDALLTELDALFERLLSVLKSDEPDTIDRLLTDRQILIDELATLAEQAPIPPEVGATLAQREAELMRALKQAMAQASSSMGQAARQSKAAMRYRRES